MSTNSNMRIQSVKKNRKQKVGDKFRRLCCCCCFCCCYELRRSSVLPFTTLWTDNAIRFLVEPGRVLHVLYLRNKKMGNSPNNRLDQDEVRKSDDVSLFTPKQEKQSYRTLTTDSSSDEEEPHNSRQVHSKTVLVKVDMERPRTNDSNLSQSSRLSLPPLNTPPITPVQNSVGESVNSGNSKKVRWRLRKKNRRTSLPQNIKNGSRKINSKEISEKLKEMDKIERLPSVPLEKEHVSPKRNIPTPLFQRRQECDNEFGRPRSAKSTFGEIWHLEGTNADIQKRTVFMIHGVGGCFQIWKHQIRSLSEYGYEIVALDMIGHGRSSVPQSREDYSFLKIQNDVVALFDRYSKETNIIIGHSYGTCFAVILARFRPDKVSHLVLISSGAPIPLSPDTLPLFPNAALRCLTPLVRRNFKRHAFCGSPTEQDLNLSFGADSVVIKKILDGQKWEEGDFAFHSMVEAQTLLIYGCEDGFVTLDEMQQMRRAIPDAHLEVIENSSHMVMLESPEQVNQLILDFVQLPVQKHSVNEPSPGSRRQSVRPASSTSRVLPHVKLLAF